MGEGSTQLFHLFFVQKSHFDQQVSKQQQNYSRVYAYGFRFCIEWVSGYLKLLIYLNSMNFFFGGGGYFVNKHRFHMHLNWPIFSYNNTSPSFFTNIYVIVEWHSMLFDSTACHASVKSSIRIKVISKDTLYSYLAVLFSKHQNL